MKKDSFQLLFLSFVSLWIQTDPKKSTFLSIRESLIRDRRSLHYLHSGKKKKNRFNLLCTAIGVTDDVQKRRRFTISTNNSYKKAPHTLEAVFIAFGNHFKPQVNPSYEAYLFHQFKQRYDETINQYYIRLREHFHDVDNKLNLVLTTTS